ATAETAPLWKSRGWSAWAEEGRAPDPVVQRVQRRSPSLRKSARVSWESSAAKSRGSSGGGGRAGRALAPLPCGAGEGAGLGEACPQASAQAQRRASRVFIRDLFHSHRLDRAASIFPSRRRIRRRCNGKASALAAVFGGAVRYIYPPRLHLGVQRGRMSADLAMARSRAQLLRALRSGLDARGYLEVETPIAVPFAGQEPHLRPFETCFRPDLPSSAGVDGARRLHLHTSPEYAMKRLLSKDHGRIWQNDRVFRGGKRCVAHNPEVTLLA